MGNCACMEGAAKGAQGAAAAVPADERTKEDSVVTLMPYYKINYGKIDDFKNATKKLYETMKPEAGMQYVSAGYCVTEGMFQHERAIIRQGWENGRLANAHITTIKEAEKGIMELCTVELYECHAPASDVFKMRNNEELKKVGCKFFTIDGKGFRAKQGNFAKGVSVSLYFKIKTGKPIDFKKTVEQMYEKAKQDMGVLCFSFAYAESGGSVHCRSMFKDGKAVAHHLKTTEKIFNELLQFSDVERVDVFAPTMEMPELQAHEFFKKYKFEFFELDGNGLQCKA